MQSQATPVEPLEIGETPRDDGGFRRVSPLPAPGALARMRAALLDVAVGGDARLAEALVGFEEWRFLTLLCDSKWSAGARRDSAAGRRLLARKLRVLGTRPFGFSAAATLPAGTPVHLSGVVRAMPRTRPTSRLESHIWGLRTVDAANVRLLVEDGHDFFLDDGEGQTVCVIAAGGHLINADRAMEGDLVSVFGLCDRIADPRADARSAHARGTLALAVRSGAEAPLLVRRQARDTPPVRDAQ